MPKISSSTALSRFRVLDLSRVRAGPACVRQLADFGADVIKIENVNPEDLAGPREGPDFQNLHRNKRSMTLNLKSKEGLKLFLDLVKTADVVVENYRPDVKFRLGIDYESLKAVNPRIILASISGFGQDGPDARRPGFDQLAQGLSGLMSVTGNAGDGPMRVGAAVADVAAGFLAAMGVLTALLEREESAEGQWVQSNLLQAGLALLDFQAARYTVSGEVATQMGNDHPTFMPTSAYRSSNGHINIAVSGLGMWEKFCGSIKREDLLLDEEFKTGPGRSKGRVRLNAQINKTISTKTTEEWMRILSGDDIPCGPIYSMDQVFADPQVKHLQASAPVEHPELGEIHLLNQPVKLSRTPAHLTASAPLRGAHTAEILSELGVSEETIARYVQEGVV